MMITDRLTHEPFYYAYFYKQKYLFPTKRKKKNNLKNTRKRVTHVRTPHCMACRTVQVQSSFPITIGTQFLNDC